MKTIVKAVLIPLLILGVTVGCRNASEASSSSQTNQVETKLPVISFIAEGYFFSAETIAALENSLKEGITVRDALKESGVVQFLDNGEIHSIGKIALSKALCWSLEINNKTAAPADWNQQISVNDKLKLSVRMNDSRQAILADEPLLLKIQGGIVKPGISHTYLLPYREELSIREMFRSSGIIELTENNKTVSAVKGYALKPGEQWIIKVNDKQLRESGLDMKLTPQDQVEISLDKL